MSEGSAGDEHGHSAHERKTFAEERTHFAAVQQRRAEKQGARKHAQHEAIDRRLQSSVFQMHIEFARLQLIDHVD